jgi:hypothetical protein
MRKLLLECSERCCGRSPSTTQRSRASSYNLSLSVPAANAALNNLLAAGIVSLVNERQWGRVFQATQVLQRLDQLPAPRKSWG